MTWLSRVWGWIVAALGTAIVALALLWRRAAGQRDAARDERDEARSERDAATRSAERERALAERRTRADAEAEAARLELEVRKRELAAEREATEARADGAAQRVREDVSATGTTAGSAEEWWRLRRGPR